MKIQHIMIALVALCFIPAFTNARAGDATTETITVTLPGLDWALEVDAPGFTVEEREFTPDGDGVRVLSVNAQEDLIMTVYLENAGQTGTSQDCREHYWNKAKQSPVKKDDVKMSELKQISLVEYTIKEYEGREVNQKHFNAYLTKDTYRIDIHISKEGFQLGEEKLFTSVLKTVRINETWDGRKTPWRIPIPRHGVLTLSVPTGWNSKLHQPPEDLPPTITFKPSADKAFEILITVIWSPGPEIDFRSLDNIKRIVRDTGRGVLSQALETELRIKEIEGQRGPVGCYYALTDKAPEPDGFEYLTQGVLGVDGLLVMFTVLTHANKAEVVRDVLEMLADAERI